MTRQKYRRGLRVLETSPRLGNAYRRMMRRSFEYVASDFDLSAQIGDIHLDLQHIDLPDGSIDVLLTPHVLEHVPETHRALSEIGRTLSPEGRMFLQVPLCRGATSVPTSPEFHDDDTLVYFNFGWDLTNLLKSIGFEVNVLVTQEFFDLLSDRREPPRPSDDGFDLISIWERAPIEDLVVIADECTSSALGLLPAHQFVTWECVKPAEPRPAD